MTGTWSSGLPSERLVGLEALDVAVHTAACRLDLARPPDEPGIYLLHHSAQVAADAPTWRRAYAALNSWPIYIGSAASLKERLCRHNRNLMRTTGLAPTDFSVTLVPTHSRGAATHGESMLQELLDPLWCQPWMAGFGSKDVGSKRHDQTVSAWATLHPRAGTGTGRPTVSAETLICQIRQYLADHSSRPVWPV